MLSPQDKPAPPPATTGWPDVDGEKLLEALAEFAAGAAHEFNNPLTVISGRAQLMAERAEPQDREVWQMIAQQAQRISTAIDRLMTFSSPPPSHPQRVELAELLDEIISETFSEIPPNAELPRCDKTIEAWPVAWADASQIREALGELLANAVAACETGRDICLTARPRPDETVEITVFDGGAGMSRPRLAKAMLPFASGPQAGGYDGLGLCRAWRLVANNQGQMRVTSQPGQGTTVEVILPKAN